jgi:hypothetical protein
VPLLISVYAVETMLSEEQLNKDADDLNLLKILEAVIASWSNQAIRQI